MVRKNTLSTSDSPKSSFFVSSLSNYAQEVYLSLDRFYCSSLCLLSHGSILLSLSYFLIGIFISPTTTTITTTSTTTMFFYMYVYAYLQGEVDGQRFRSHERGVGGLG